MQDIIPASQLRRFSFRLRLFDPLIRDVADAKLALAGYHPRVSAFNLLEAVPFVIGGGLSALSYWLVAER